MEGILKEQHKFNVKQNHYQRTRIYLEARRKITPHKYRHNTEPTSIDQDCIRIINSKTPNRINTLLKNKGLTRNARNLTQPDPKPFFEHRPSLTEMKVFKQSYFRQHTRFINSSEKQFSVREQLKTKLGLYKRSKQSFHDLDKASITYFQKKFLGNDCTFGRYKEKMHPMCQLYDETAEKFVSDRIIPNIFKEQH